MKTRSSYLKLLRRLFGLMGTVAIASLPLLAQIGANTGLRGIVSDPSEAVVAGASVTVTRVDTQSPM